MEAGPGKKKILIVNGDDMGASSSINEAIIEAHRRGILTSASIMVNGPAFEEAVSLAKSHPTLSVGIHLAVVRSGAALPVWEIPVLADSAGNLPGNPVAAGFNFYFNKELRKQLEREAEAQIRNFLAAGLTPTHIDGHLHFQVHPAVAPIAVRLAGEFGIRCFRLPREPLLMNLRLNSKHIAMKAFHSFVYSRLCANAEKLLRERGLFFPDRFFGLLASGFMDEEYLLGVIAGLPDGVTEIGMHPAMSLPSEMREWAPEYQYEKEFQALTSPRVKDLVREKGIVLAGYGYFANPDLSDPPR